MQAHRITTIVTLVALLSAGVARAQTTAQDAAARWHAVVSALEPAAFVSLRTKDGRRTKGTVIAAGDRTFTFVPHTRIPVEPREIAYDQIATLERAREGMSPGLKVLIGAGAGVGGFLLIVVMALAAYGD
jgi:hypothetical protein